MSQTVNENLKKALSSLNRSYEEIEKETGISRRTWYRLTQPGMSIKHEYINTLNEKYGISPSAIFGIDNGSKNIVLSQPEDYNSTDPNAIFGINIDDKQYSIIPYYPIQAAAGHGSIVDEEPEAIPLLFQTAFLKRRIGSPVASLMLVGVCGDSMYPTYQAGDMVMVDRSRKQPAQDDVYLCRIDEHHIIKRIQLLPGERIKLTSDNDYYDPIIVEKEEKDIEILGRIVWMCRSM